MKCLKLLFYLSLFTPIICYSQNNLVLPSIAVPGSTSIGVFNGVVLGQNLMGPRRITFTGNQMNLERKETGETSGSSTGAIDKLATLFTLRIFSPGITQPVLLENKTQEELNLIELRVFPVNMGMPYNLFLDLKVQVSTKPISASLSDDAGVYDARVNISIGTLDGNNHNDDDDDDHDDHDGHNNHNDDSHENHDNHNNH